MTALSIGCSEFACYNCGHVTDRAIRVVSALALACVGGFPLAIHFYSGPSIPVGLGLVLGFGCLIALLSLLFGRDFWGALLWIVLFLWR